MTDDFWEIMQRVRLPQPGDQETLSALTQAASSWRSEGKLFGAAYALEWASHAAWGDPQVMASCLTLALSDYQQFADRQAPCSNQSLAAFKKSAQLYWNIERYFDRPGLREFANDLLRDLAERLLTCYAGSPEKDSYLVRGIVIATDLEHEFTAETPEFEVDWHAETWNAHDRVANITIPSAFHVFIYLGDYFGAQEVVDLCPNAFTTPSLRGWKAAVRGFLASNQAADAFEQASAAFGEDREPSHEELITRGGLWSAVNIQLWSPYFQARSAIAHAVQEPDRAREFVEHAAQIISDKFIGWGEPKVHRFAALVRALAHLLGTRSPDGLSRAREDFIKDARFSGEEPEDEIAIRFLTLSLEAFEAFQKDAARELTSGRLRDALDALRRIPLLEPGFAEAVGPAVGKQAWNIALGPVRTRMHRTLESIHDERHLQRITLRLLQGSLPLYAQVLHGALEYGKDVVALLEEDGQRVLRMYQVKAGDINTPVWRAAHQELEEMFLVPLSNFQLPLGPEPRRQGILICNGHALPNVTPVMEGWFQEQRSAHHREFTFMHLDELVQWVERDRLVSELKAALSELNIPIIV